MRFAPTLRGPFAESGNVARTTETVTITGRTPVPLRKKLNPLWWFLNDLEEQVAPWYEPDWPQWKRELWWNVFRNPAQNLRAVVIGVGDRNYTVWGKAPALTVQRDDLDPPELGYQWSVIKLGWIWLPFISYSGQRIVCYAGWQPNGFFGAKFNVRKAPVTASGR